jgi:hypothetical protein
MKLPSLSFTFLLVLSWGALHVVTRYHEVNQTFIGTSGGLNPSCNIHIKAEEEGRSGSAALAHFHFHFVA